MTINGSSMTWRAAATPDAGPARAMPPPIDGTSAPADGGQGMAVQLGLLRLAQWPAIPQLKPEEMADMSRLCALLARRDTAAAIVPRLLGLSRERAQSLLLALHADGCLTVLGQTAHDTTASAADGSSGREAADLQEQDLPPQASFITKLWKRLVTVS
jgi:hypothetical protein